MSGPRYSIIPARFVDDARLKVSHFKVLGYLGKHSHKTGWMKLSQTKAGKDESLGLTRETICRAISDLVDWGYVEKRSKQQTKTSICFYRVIMDAVSDPVENEDDLPDVVAGCDPALTGGCDAAGHRVVTQQITRVVTSDITTREDHSLKIKIERSSAGADSEDSKSGLKSEVRVAATALTITATDPQWMHWMVHLRNRGREDLATQAEAAGAITTVGSRWPKADSPLPFIKQVGLTEKSERMAGGA